MRQARHGKVLRADEGVLGVNAIFVQVVAEGKGVSEQVVPESAGAGVNQDEDGNVLGEASTHTPDGNLQGKNWGKK